MNRNRLHNRSLSNAWCVFILSTVISALTILPMLFANGGHLYLVGDYMTQQIPFMKECRRMLLSGEPFWSWNTFLGGNFVGTYSFYVYGSPFFWPLLLIPENAMTIGIGVMFVLKHTVAALTAYLYLKRHIKTPHFAVIGSLMYAFSSFSMDSSFYYHFLDVIAFFPLLLYAVDEVLENRGKVLMPLIVMLCAITNYYFFVSTSVFFLIYLLARVKFSDTYTWKDAARCIVFYGVGCFAAAIILLPSACCLLETSKATDSFSSILSGIVVGIPQIIKTLRSLVFPSEGILGAANGFAFGQYCSSAAFLPFFGIVLTFAAMRKKEASWDYKLTKWLFVISLIALCNGIFSLFSNINYTRWWYAFVLIMIVSSLHVLEDGREDLKASTALYRRSIKPICIIGAVTILLPFIAKLLVLYVLDDFIAHSLDPSIRAFLQAYSVTDPLDLKTLCYAIVFFVMVAINYLPLYFALKKGWVYKATAVIPAVALICAATYGIYLTNETIFYNRESGDYEGTATAVSEDVSYDSRTYHHTTLANYGMIVNEPGVTTFHSFKSHATSQFARLAGYSITMQPTTLVRYDTPAIQTVLSISSITAMDKTKTAAPYYVPMGYVYDYYTIDEGYEYLGNTKEHNKRVETMVSACYIDRETLEQLDDLIKPIPQDIDWKDGFQKAKQTAATDVRMTGSGLSATSSGDRDRLLYFSIPHDNGWTAYINGKEVPIYTINGGMMGIVAPAGTSHIELRFMPPGLVLGAGITIATLLGLTVYAVVSSLTKRRKISPTVQENSSEI